MRITILAHGSRGDIQPYVALGIGLQQAGHTVRLAAPQLFESFVTGYGLEFAPLAGDPTQLMQRAVEKAGAGANLFRISRVVLEYALPLAAQVMTDARQACQGADAIIHSLLMTTAGHEIARQLDRPDFSALLFAVFAPTAAFPNPSFPDLPLGPTYNRLTHEIFSQLFWQGGRLAYAWIRRKDPALPRLSAWPFSASNKRPTPILYGFSPHVLPRPSDWGDNVHVTGYWFLETAPSWQPPVELVEFLEGGPPPVYIGFGSVISREARELTEMVLAALAQTGQRGLLLTGWGGLARADWPERVFQIDSVPFDWLFPRMRVIVHHGGMGTTAAALRAGIPSVVVPFTADQPFWGRRVYQLGVGSKPIPHKKLTVQSLTEAIHVALSDQTMQRRAEALGERLRSEDGVTQAVQVIEQYLATSLHAGR
jgi:UDP:flavonoid glycosyltransferase YjiC (YdhE family)